MNTTLKYTVMLSDSYYSIAVGINAATGMTFQAIEQANPGVNPNVLLLGQVLNIPATSGSGIALHYTVVSGDTLSGIAAGINASAGVTYQQIVKANQKIRHLFSTHLAASSVSSTGSTEQSNEGIRNASLSSFASSSVMFSNGTSPAVLTHSMYGCLYRITTRARFN
jgi:LysM repeat protein